ncbi:hypothetical protein MVES1_000471 [Malassezia vespertilionis]|uniref:uncharacterized protein n=1 Tax=Malassezia vespertilionis TaxID=2020962 RepID=UPI0024B25835|nr:uncharacterized protein MVES1_000471 [Malassezia vespertilionis]WFD05145.1 hypothetical protein MVES1_000471 [Malassezia vespertilionis]
MLNKVGLSVTGVSLPLLIRSQAVRLQSSVASPLLEERGVLSQDVPELPRTSSPIPIRYPYFVARVGSNNTNLPVYSEVRRARSRWLTEIRKVDGDVTALCRDLFEDFGWGDPYDKLNPDAQFLQRTSSLGGSKKIVLRGNWTRDVKAWLEERGF